MTKTFATFLGGLVLACLLHVPASHATGTPAAPTGKVVLTVGGNVAIPNAGTTATFDMAMLEALPQITMVTHTPWDGSAVVTFKGPLIRDILAAAGATGTKATVTALNDYKVLIPAADFAKDNVILATRRNGQPMSVRNKGPLWVIYPLADKPELDTYRTHTKMAWQVKAIDLK
jgi:hypothetical protein